MKLYDFQLEAIKKMKRGCILCGDVGSGKSITSLGYYYLRNGGDIESLKGGDYMPMDDPPKDLYIITTARKRDTLEWEKELGPFLMSTHKDCDIYRHNVAVDSWNNIKKYVGVYDAFFIFDEQRVVGSGTWVKAFLKITRKNEWILLSATPGDTWQDYIPVFVANGFYKNKTEFLRRHAVYSRYTKYPKIERFIDTGHLCRLRNDILVPMDFKRDTVQHHEYLVAEFNRDATKQIFRTRWNPWKNEPIENAAELYYCARKIANSDISRQALVLEVFEDHPRLNTPYKDLYYYHLTSKSFIDLRIAKAYEEKRDFNANRDFKRHYGDF